MRHEPSIYAAHVHPVVTRLTEIRLAWGLSLEYIANKIGCSYFTLIHMESGQKQPNFKTLIRWASALGYDLSLRPQQGLVNHRVSEIQN